MQIVEPWVKYDFNIFKLILKITISYLHLLDN